jgi:hypothetical protein
MHLAAGAGHKRHHELPCKSRALVSDYLPRQVKDMFVDARSQAFRVMEL